MVKKRLSICNTFGLGALSQVAQAELPSFVNAGISATPNLEQNLHPIRLRRTRRERPECLDRVLCR